MTSPSSSSESKPGPRLLILDTSYSLEVIRDRDLQRAVTSQDLDGFFEHVWTCHPLVGAADDHSEDRGVGAVREEQIDERHTFIEGPIERFPRLEGLLPVNFLLAQSSLVQHLLQLIREEDISLVRAGDPTYLGLLGYVLARLSNVPFAIRVSGHTDRNYELTEQPNYPRLLRSRKLEKRIERFVLPRADLVIAPNEDNLGYAIDNGADPAYAAIFRYGNLLHPVHFEEPGPRRKRSTVRSECDIPQEAPLLTFVGRLEEVKHVSDLIPVLEKVKRSHPEAVLLLVGDGSLEEELGEEASRLGIRQDVRFAGYRDQEWISEALAISDIILAPHMGRALVEAALSSTPIVAYDFDWHEELIETDDSGVLVPFGDRSAMADAAIRLIEEPATAERLGRSARDRALEEHHPERIMEVQRDAYREVLQKDD